MPEQSANEDRISISLSGVSLASGDQITIVGNEHAISIPAIHTRSNVYEYSVSISPVVRELVDKGYDVNNITELVAMLTGPEYGWKGVYCHDQCVASVPPPINNSVREYLVGGSVSPHDLILVVGIQYTLVQRIQKPISKSKYTTSGSYVLALCRTTELADTLERLSTISALAGIDGGGSHTHR